MPLLPYILQLFFSSIVPHFPLIWPFADYFFHDIVCHYSFPLRRIWNWETGYFNHYLVTDCTSFNKSNLIGKIIVTWQIFRMLGLFILSVFISKNHFLIIIIKETCFWHIIHHPCHHYRTMHYTLQTQFHNSKQHTTSLLRLQFNFADFLNEVNNWVLH